MKIKGLFLLFFAALFFSQPSYAWWNGDWSHRAKVTVNTADDGAAIKGALGPVTLLVRLHTGNFSFADAKPDGTDLRFVDADDKTPLKYHIEKFDGLTEIATVWVQMPTLAPSAKTDIWVYYGNSKAPAGDDAKGSYDVGQAIAFHFDEKDGMAKDSTAYANNASQSVAKQSTAGLIGNGLSFDGSGKLTVAASPSLKIGANGFAVEMWVKPADVTQKAALFHQHEGANDVTLMQDGDKLVAQINGVAVATAAGLTAGAWHHVGVAVKDGASIYLDGQEVGKGGTPAGLAVGGDVVIGDGYKGDMDEFGYSNVSRPAEWFRVAFTSAGEGQKLVNVNPAEASDDSGGGTSTFKILIGSVTLDGWVVIGILIIMMVVSFAVMVGKAIFITRTQSANKQFKEKFAAILENLTTHDTGYRPPSAETFSGSSLYRVYEVGIGELRGRIAAYRAKGRELILSAQSIDAIRASMDAAMVRETNRLNAQMVLLTIAIAGGPFLGLLGTVVGVMITFAAIAAAGDVNVNSIAPGIAAALVATVAGLAVAIPSLFGYNYLASKIKEVTSEMHVFADEMITKVAEQYSI